MVIFFSNVRFLALGWLVQIEETRWARGLFVRNAYIRLVNLLVNIFCSYLAYLRSACANVP